MDYTIAQKRTYIGVEVGPKFELLESSENFNTDPFYYCPTYGFILGQEINNALSFETGLYKNEYGDKVELKNSSMTLMSNSMETFNIPIRLKANLNMGKKVKFSSILGYHFGINNTYQPGGSSYRKTQHLEMSAFYDYRYKKYFSMIESGIRVEYNHAFGLGFYSGVNYVKGLNLLKKTTAYSYNDGYISQIGKIYSKGDYFSFTFGVQYAFSNLWNGPKIREKMSTE